MRRVPGPGFYIGIGAGAGSVRDRTVGRIRSVLMGSAAEGVFGTVVVGYDRMLTSRIVGGIFADYDFASNVSTDFSIGPFGVSIEQKNTLSVGARLGVLSSPTTLWYGTAGYTQTELTEQGLQPTSRAISSAAAWRASWSVAGTCVPNTASASSTASSEYTSTLTQRRAVRAFGSRCPDLQVGSRGARSRSRSRSNEVVGVAPASRLIGPSARAALFASDLCAVRPVRLVM